MYQAWLGLKALGLALEGLGFGNPEPGPNSGLAKAPGLARAQARAYIPYMVIIADSFKRHSGSCKSKRNRNCTNTMLTCSGHLPHGNSPVLRLWNIQINGSVSMFVGSKSGVLRVLRGTCFDWLNHQGPSISGTRYS